MEYICKPQKISIYINTKKLTAAQVKNETGCTAIINGGLYDMTTFNPVCHLKADGKVYAADQYKYFGLAWNDSAPALVSDYSAYQNYICCVCMVRNGKAEKMICSSEVSGARPRTALGVFHDGRVWLYYSSAKTTPEALQEAAVKAGVLHAVMLDGGASTQGITPSGTITSSRVVHNFICVWAEDETKEDDKMKIYLSPSSQSANEYAAGGTNEQEQCRRIAEFAKTALDRCGFETKIGAASINYTGRVAESNSWGADIHVPIHTNAGGGHGPLVFVYSLSTARTALAQPVFDALNGIAPTKSKNGVRANAGLYEVAKSSGKCVYIEAAFHDDADEAQWIVANAEAVGEAICKGICEGCGVTYVQPNNETTPQEKTLEDRIAALEAWAQEKGYKGA